MSQKVWLGSIFIKNEGGYDIIMRALNHYNRRLRRISSSPEISGGGSNAMLSSVLESASLKITPKLKPIANKLRASLVDPSELLSVEHDIEIIEKSMICYKSDIKKAIAKTHDYYTDLVKDNSHINSDLALIDESIRRLKQYDDVK